MLCKAVAASDVRLSGLDFKQLVARAEAQYAKVEERGLAAIPTALKPAKS
jgi:hypothetical protein